MEHQQKLGRRALENDFYFSCGKGGCPNLDELDAILEQGDGVAMPPNAFMYNFGLTLSRHDGRNTFFLAKPPYARFTRQTIQQI